MEKEGNKNTVILMRIEKIETFKYTLLDLLKFIEEKNANEWITSQTWVQIVWICFNFIYRELFLLVIKTK